MLACAYAPVGTPREMIATQMSVCSVLAVVMMLAYLMKLVFLLPVTCHG